MLAIRERLNTARKYLIVCISRTRDIHLKWKPDVSTWDIGQIVEHIATKEDSSIKSFNMNCPETKLYIWEHTTWEDDSGTAEEGKRAGTSESFSRQLSGITKVFTLFLVNCR